MLVTALSVCREEPRATAETLHEVVRRIAEVVRALVAPGHALWACDRTPPPYVKRIREVCEAQGVLLSTARELTIAAVPTPAVCADLAAAVNNWTDCMRLVALPDVPQEDRSGTPCRIRGARDPRKWLEANTEASLFAALLGLEPASGLELRTKGLAPQVVMAALELLRGDSAGIGWHVNIDGTLQGHGAGPPHVSQACTA